MRLSLPFLLLLPTVSFALVIGGGASGRGIGRVGHPHAVETSRGRGNRGRGRGGSSGAGRAAPGRATGDRAQTTRRGANRKWFQRRADGDSAARRRKGPRPKRWEREGDQLYDELHSDPSIHFRGLSPADMRDAAEAMLAQLHGAEVPPAQLHGAEVPPEETPAAAVPVAAPPQSPAMWGSCSVGPVLRGRLEAAGLRVPTPIQEAAFTPISQGRNVVLGSATGSGKTLAFLLPIFTTSARTTPCRTLVVTASSELTAQLQREVDRLWPPQPLAEGGAPVSALHIVGGATEREERSLHPHAATGERAELQALRDAPVAVGTPHALRRLMLDADAALADGGVGAQKAEMLRANLRVLVLDEADELLQSAAAARLDARRRAISTKQGTPLSARQRMALKRGAAQSSPTEGLLAVLPVPLPKLQLICASATVGRTLRRQLQALLGAPSIEKAAELVAPSERQAKRIQTRRAALMPSTLSHRYHLVESAALAVVSTPCIDASADAVDAAASVPANGPADGSYHASACTNGTTSVVTPLLTAMQALPPGPAIVFAGRIGVDVVGSSLAACGMAQVRTLQDAHAQPFSCDVPPSPDTLEALGVDAGWDGVNIYVGSERWGRGIDLDVDYVFLLAPPTSSAAYAHLSGRTGRCGREGTAITILSHEQAPRLVGFADALGIAFTPLLQASCGE